MSKRKKIIIIVIIIIVVAILGKLFIGPAPFASSYTKNALRKDFSIQFNSIVHPTPDSTSITIVPSEPNGIANVLVYVYYAYQDYQAGRISKKQFLEVMANTKGSIDFLTEIFNTNYNEVIKNDPIEVENVGECYVQTSSDGSQLWNTVNEIKISKLMVDLVNKMYQSQDPDEIYADLKLYSVYLEQSTFYFSLNTQYDLDSTINVQNFDPKWLFNNLAFTTNSVQKLFGFGSYVYDYQVKHHMKVKYTN